MEKADIQALLPLVPGFYDRFKLSTNRSSFYSESWCMHAKRDPKLEPKPQQHTQKQKQEQEQEQEP
jgi:hypothetical protein